MGAVMLCTAEVPKGHRRRSTCQVGQESAARGPSPKCAPWNDQIWPVHERWVHRLAGVVSLWHDQHNGCVFRLAFDLNAGIRAACSRPAPGPRGLRRLEARARASALRRCQRRRPLPPCCRTLELRGLRIRQQRNVEECQLGIDRPGAGRGQQRPAGFHAPCPLDAKGRNPSRALGQ